MCPFHDFFEVEIKKQRKILGSFDFTDFLGKNVAKHAVLFFVMKSRISLRNGVFSSELWSEELKFENSKKCSYNEARNVACFL